MNKLTVTLLVDVHDDGRDWSDTQAITWVQALTLQRPKALILGEAYVGQAHVSQVALRTEPNDD